MTLRFIYDNFECNRVIPAVVLDSRSTIPALKGAGGFAVKAYTDAEVAKIVDGVAFYKLETEAGNLAAYVAINGSNGTVVTYQIRPAFQSLSANILNQISNFINGSSWRFDVL